MTFGAFYQWANLLALLLSTGVAVWRGGWPERIAAVAMAAAWLATATALASVGCSESRRHQ